MRLNVHRIVRVIILWFGLCNIVAAVPPNFKPPHANRAAAPPENTFYFASRTLSDDLTELPVLANGHVGFLLFSDAVFMNGLYNGEAGESHRARIPNWASLRFGECLENNATGCVFAMDVKGGFFETSFVTLDYAVVHTVYAHRYFNRAIVNQFFVTRLNREGPIEVNLYQNPGNISRVGEQVVSTDIDVQFEAEQTIEINGQSVFVECGETLKIEDTRYQESWRKVCALWNEVPERIVLAEDENVATFTFVLTIDEDYRRAEEELGKLLYRPPDLIFQDHTYAWNVFWQNFDIEIQGNDQLASVIHAAIWYLTSSLPATLSNQPAEEFYFLSPGGLGRGGYHADYAGHGFWDTEIWMQPTVNIIRPKWALDLLRYRFRNLKAAADNAETTGYEGVRFPWESAYTGREVTPDCCPLGPMNQIHITADVSFAIRYYFGLSHDYDYLQREGCELAQQVARFWASRASFNETTRFYEIRKVMGPDEDHEEVDNNVYTNVIAGYALYFGHFTDCLCRQLQNDTTENEEAEEWLKIAKHLKLLYDEELDYHPQYEDYEIGTIIKQADTVLLGYPLLYPMNDSTRENDLKTYEGVTRETGPAMTWAMHAIGHLDIGELDEGQKLANRSFQDYVREPYFTWSEVIRGEPGAVNFITGCGGFLQTILAGFVGIRVHLDHLELRIPILPDKATRVKLTGLHYMGTFNLEYGANEAFIMFTSLPQDLYITRRSVRRRISRTYERWGISNGARLEPVEPMFGECKVPEDRIGEQLEEFYTSNIGKTNIEVKLVV